MITINVRTSTARRTTSADVIDTPKSVFEAMGVDISGTSVNLAGKILSAADLDKTFEDLGVQDGTSVNMNSIVKADGAVSLGVAGDAFVVTSSLPAETIKLVKKWKPDALKIKDKDGNDVFAVSFAEGHASISKAGITFGGTSHDEAGLATVTQMIPAGTKNVLEYITDTMAPVYENLKTIEAAAAAAAEEIKVSRDTLAASITMA